MTLDLICAKNALDNEMKNFQRLTGVWKQYFVGIKMF